MTTPSSSNPAQAAPRWSLRNSLFPHEGRRITLGLGLIGIGKPWGHRDARVPSEAQARQLLETAYSLGIRYLDTAPSYGISEQRVSGFLHGLTPEQRSSLTVATKFGEHWDAAREQPFVDHSYDALARSLDGSLKRLGRIDILQLHKTTPDVLRSRDLERALCYAHTLDVPNLGASVSDLESARIAVSMRGLSVLQLPLNPASLRFIEAAQTATNAGMLIAANRPFGMGGLLYTDQPLTKSDAFSFLAAQPFDGVVLSGTKSPEHLHENWIAFHEALQA